MNFVVSWVFLGKKPGVFFFVCKKALIGLEIENKVQYVEDCKS